MTSQQQNLPFGQAEGCYAERKALLWCALQQCSASPSLVRLAEWLFDATAGAVGEPVTATYRELATKPWMLNCSRSTLKRAVAEGVASGILAAEEVFDQHGRNAGNRFGINQAGVRGLIHRASVRGPVGVQNEPVPVQREPLGVQIEPLKQGCEVAAEDPHRETPRARAPNETNEPMKPMKEAQASQPTPMQRSLVSSRSAGAARAETRAEPEHASRPVADLIGRLPTPEQYAARRAALKARIARAIADPDCHDSLAGRAADLVCLHGVPISQVDAILDSLVDPRSRARINTTAGAWANGAFRRLAKKHGIKWGKADDG